MKATILKYLQDLIECDDDERATGLKPKIISLVSDASLKLDKEQESHLKNLITSTVANYSCTTDESLKAALAEHYKTLEELLED